MPSRIHVSTDLVLEAGTTVIRFSDTEDQRLQVRLSDLEAVGNLPISRFKAYQLLRRTSRLLDQTIAISVADQPWLSCRDGRLSVHNFSLTLKAFLQ